MATVPDYLVRAKLDEVVDMLEPDVDADVRWVLEYMGEKLGITAIILPEGSGPVDEIAMRSRALRSFLRAARDQRPDMEPEYQEAMAEVLDPRHLLLHR